MLFQYLDGFDKSKAAAVAQEQSKGFQGRQESFATKLKDSHIKELIAEPQFLIDIENFIYDMLSHYYEAKSDNPVVSESIHIQKLLCCRGYFLAHVGKFLMGVGRKLADLVAKANNMTKHEPSPEERAKLVAEEFEDAFNVIETWYRGELCRTGLSTMDLLPPMKYTLVAAKRTAPLEKDKKPEQKVKDQKMVENSDDTPCNTLEHHFKRLEIKKFGDIVWAFVGPKSDLKLIDKPIDKPFSKPLTIVKLETKVKLEVDNSDDESDVLPVAELLHPEVFGGPQPSEDHTQDEDVDSAPSGSQPRRPTPVPESVWMQCRLMELHGVYAVVEEIQEALAVEENPGEEKNVLMKIPPSLHNVSVNSLKSVYKDTKKKKPVDVHASLLQRGENILDGYSYDFAEPDFLSHCI